MNQLFSDDEDSLSGRDVQLTINEHYAKAFGYRKEREELERLKAKYGSDYDPNTSGSELSTDSESAESEDEDGEELTPKVDAAILRTLARIKKRDPAIYDSSKNIFGEEQETVTFVSTKRHPKSMEKTKPFTIHQAKLESMLHGSRSQSPENDFPRPLTHVEEQEELRKETIAAFHNAIPEGEGDDFLVLREKTKDELEMEEEDYRAFLEREVGNLRELVELDGDAQDRLYETAVGVEADSEGKGEEKGDRKKKKKRREGNDGGVVRKKTKAEEDQDFLMNYILNRGWIDRSARHVPTYDEVTSTMRRKKKQACSETSEVQNEGSPTNIQLNDEGERDSGLESDASFESLASHFEASYNHRFEEPGAATIPTFPRTIQSTVRRQDTTRKEARERKKARKEEELEKKREEIRRLKALKMRDVKRKLEIIGRQAGLKKKGKGKDESVPDEEDDGLVDEALHELDLEGDWDPEKYDRQMAGLFNRNDDAFEDDGANEEDSLRFDEDGKPVWDDDVDIGDITMQDDDDNVQSKENQKKDKKKKKKKKKDQGGDEEGVDVDAMDADAPQVFGEEEEEVWDGSEEMRKRVLKKYMDELDAFDFNDMVGGDLPTRFKYVPVAPANYSLTPAEILMATNKELNEYVSVKKYAPYRQDKPEKHRFNKTNQEKLRELKTKVVERTGGASSFGITEKKKRKGKKERMKMKTVLAGADDGPEIQSKDAVDSLVVDGPSSSKKRKREESNLNDITLGVKENGETPDANQERAPKKKRKRKHKKDGE